MPHYQLVIIGAGPGGSAAAITAGKLGLSVALIDAQTFPRDKTCGDGLTPRAMQELDRLGLSSLLPYRSRGLALHGFGSSVEIPWPHGTGSAFRRTHLDHLLFTEADSQASVDSYTGHSAMNPRFAQGRLESVALSDKEERIYGDYFIIADGVRSTIGKELGRQWHRNEVYGIAARAYCSTPRANDPWIHSHLELRDTTGDEERLQPGYGWIFPLGATDGHANIGCGALSTAKRPAKINTKKLLRSYIDTISRTEGWKCGAPTDIASALLPMGGAVSHVAGPNWILIGDAAACVNPLNGEGIDYALETARLGVQLIQDCRHSCYSLELLWPALLREEYGAAFSLARKAAVLLTYPGLIASVGPYAMRLGLMPAAARIMGNLIYEEDKDLLAYLWRRAGKAVEQMSKRPLWD